MRYMRLWIGTFCMMIVVMGAYANDQSWYDADHHQIPQPRTSHFRNYDSLVTKEEKKDISYIITYLAHKSYFTLLRHRGQLNAAGSRIKHVHPLRFLMCVFTDEELNNGIKKIHKEGGMIWSDFIGGLKESLKEEFQRNNLRNDQINDFAKTIDVETETIFACINEKKWGEMVVYLIKNVQ